MKRKCIIHNNNKSFAVYSVTQYMCDDREAARYCSICSRNRTNIRDKKKIVISSNHLPIHIHDTRITPNVCLYENEFRSPLFLSLSATITLHLFTFFSLLEINFSIFIRMIPMMVFFFRSFALRLYAHVHMSVVITGQWIAMQ